MAKKVRKKRTARPATRKTNWVVIGGVVGIGIVGIFALLFVSLQGDGASGGSSNNLLLNNFCDSNAENCIELGDEDAPVTFIEVSDYGCGHCRNFNLQKADALTAQYVDNSQVKWVVVPFALRGQSGDYPTLPTAVSAMCANEQGSFFDYHRAMFEIQGTPLFNTEDGFMEAAVSLNMDTEAFASCLQSNSYEDVILRNISMAGNAGLRSTPTFFINGRKVEGNLPNLSDFQQVIEAALGSS